MLPEKKVIKWIVYVVLGLLVFGNLIGSIRTVDAGTVEVVTRWGKVTGKVLRPGLNYTIPFVERTIGYNTKKITYETAEGEKWEGSNADYKDYPVSTTTKDGQGVNVTYTIRFRVDSNKATWIVENLGSEEATVDKIVKTDSRGWIRTIIRDFGSEDLYSGNIRDAQEKIFGTLEPRFADNGLVLDEIVLREPRFDKAYEQVMEAKQRELEKVKVEEYIADQAEEQKRADITRAQAEAEAQRLQRETLDPQVLEKLALEVKLIEAEAKKISAQKGIPIVPSTLTILGESAGVFYQLPK